jgi:hypothetical protein
MNMNRSRLVTNVTSKLSLRSNVNSKEKKCEKQNECQQALSICCEFKIVKRRLVENVGLILNAYKYWLADLGYCQKTRVINTPSLRVL